MPFSKHDFYDPYQSADSFLIHEMIESDMRQQQQHLDSCEDSSHHNNNTWLTHTSDASIDFDTSGLLVNPQTATPVNTHDDSPLQPSSAYVRINPETKNTDNYGHKINRSRFVSTTSSSSSSSSSDDEDTTADDPDETYTSLEGEREDERDQSSSVISFEKYYPKPIYSYSCLIAMALKNSETGCLPVSEIYNFMTKNYPYFKTAPNGWKNSVRHNLSLSHCFHKVDKPSGKQRKGCLWTMNPDKIEKMDDEVFKWSQKDPLGIKQSMAKPEDFGVLEKFCDKHEKQMEDIRLELTNPRVNFNNPNKNHVEARVEEKEDIKDDLENEVNLDNSLLDSTYHVDFWGELNEKLDQDIPITDFPETCTPLLSTGKYEQENAMLMRGSLKENTMLSGGLPSRAVKINLV